ncbi:MAG TPA: polymer-forming cytoskeletal protein [Steroidobacteraceae bacterium]|nr:polymer-forming cytoskeletal protein [Steroidobacteraceae bacterium]
MRELSRTIVALVAGLAAACALATSLLADDTEPVTVEPPDSDSFITGDDVASHGEMSGSSVLAGGRIDSAAKVHGDAVLFGGDVRMTGEAKEDLYAVGGDIEIDGRVGNDVRAAGGQVTLGPAAEVLGDATIAAGRAIVEGKIAGDLEVAGGHVRLNGSVQGNVTVRAGELDIGPATRVAGRLQYETTGSPSIDPAAQIAGGLEAKPQRWYGRWFSTRSTVGGPGWFGIFVVGSIMILASPGLGGRLLDHLKSRAGAAIGWGLVCFIATPIALVLCAITIIGLPLAVVLLLAFLLLLLAGAASGVVALGQWALARVSPARAGAAGWQILALVTVLIAIEILRHLPILGRLLSFAIIVAGIGLLLLELSRRMRSTPSSASG